MAFYIETVLKSDHIHILRKPPRFIINNDDIYWTLTPSPTLWSLRLININEYRIAYQKSLNFNT